MHRLLGGVVFALFGLSSAAHAVSHCEGLLGGEFGCACAVSLDGSDPQTTAILSNIVGNVDITTSNQYSPADPAIPLNVGDGVIVFEDSSAFLTFGPTCSRQLPEQSSLVIREIEGCACASLVEAQRVARSQNLSVSEDTQSNSRRGIAALLLLGGGVGAFFALQADDDEPVTPD